MNIASLPIGQISLDLSGTLQAIALGALLGALGQGARMIVGLKKTADEARAQKLDFSAVFEASQLWISIVIGAVAGGLATLTMLDKMNPPAKETIMALIAAGYAGADFIEGFMRDEAGAGKRPARGESQNQAPSYEAASISEENTHPNQPKA